MKESNIRNITQDMISIVNGFKSVWQGEAATGFSNRFASLSDDMNRLYELIRKHSDNLRQMAEEYRSAEDESNALAQSLTGGAVS